MYDLEANDRANKAALLLAYSRYIEQFAPFVKGKYARLSYVEPQIAEMLDQCAKETNGEIEYVTERFATFLRESVPSAIPEGSIGIRNENDADSSEFVKTDVMDRGEVPGLGREEAIKDGVVKYDLSQDTLKTGCVRCSKEIDSKLAGKSIVCSLCTSELQQLAWDKQADGGYGWDNTPGQMGQMGTGVDQLHDPSAQGLMTAQDPNMPYTCSICGQTGSHDEILAHVQNDHGDVLQRQQQSLQGQTPGSMQNQNPTLGKKADTGTPDDAARVEPLTESPGDHFDSIVSDLAERAAARHFSLPNEEQIQSIASQLGISADEVRNSLVSIATFGNYVGMNGELGAESNAPQGYEAISVQGLGNNPHQALVPTDLVVTKVAEDMNLEQQLAYNMIRDKYGADLPEQYHAQVQGQQQFYLPSELAQNQMQQQPAQQPTDPNVGPAFQQTPPGAPVPSPAEQFMQPGQSGQQPQQ